MLCVLSHASTRKTPGGLVCLDGMRNTLDLSASENPKVAMSLGKDGDETVLDELEKEGFFKKLARK